MKRHTTIIALLALAGCDAASPSPQALRSADMCPPGCECICVDPTTSTGSDTGSDTTTDTDPSASAGTAATTASASTGGDTGPATSSDTGATPATLSDAIAAMGATPGVDDGESIWGTFPDGRRFRVRYPYPWDPANPTPTRVIFAFHACSNSRASGEQWDSYHWPGAGGFMVVLPEADGVCWRTDPADPTDFYHAQRVIEGVEAWPFVDDVRRLTGWSGGTFMSQSLACNIGADILVAGSGGMRYIGDSNDLTDMPASCLSPVDIFLHHGQADTTVPLQYGQEAVDMWAATLGCSNPVPNTEPLDYCSEPGIECGASPGCVAYTCAEGSLRWCIDESGHSQQYAGRAAREVGEILFDTGGV